MANPPLSTCFIAGLCAVVLLSCAPADTPANRVKWQKEYNAWVVVCTCEFLADEAKEYTGMTYGRIVGACNGIAKQSLSAYDGYPRSFAPALYNPAIGILPCQADVTFWREMLRN